MKMQKKTHYNQMITAKTRKLLENTAWNGKIITTIADIIVMELIFSTQQIYQYFIHPTQG